jgi:hypothetical protein
MVMLVQHDISCPGRGLGHSDAAKRASDEYQLHRIANPIGSVGGWLAIALADGRSDHVLYPSKRDAARYQHGMEQFYAFTQIRPCNMSVCDAEVFLRIHRKMYDAGLRMTDPDNVRMPEPIRRSTREDMASQMRTITSGGRTRPSNLIIGGK